MKKVLYIVLLIVSCIGSIVSFVLFSDKQNVEKNSRVYYVENMLFNDYQKKVTRQNSSNKYKRENANRSSELNKIKSYNLKLIKQMKQKSNEKVYRVYKQPFQSRPKTFVNKSYSNSNYQRRNYDNTNVNKPFDEMQSKQSDGCMSNNGCKK